MIMPDVRQRVMLAPYTTLKVGGPAEYFAIAKSEEEMAALAGFARERGLEFTVIGGGSNILVSDDGIQGLVVKNEIKGVSSEVDGERVFLKAGSGEIWDDVVAHSVEAGWGGLENLSAIPGTVGATPVQNVGAYGIEVGEVIASVRVLDITTGEISEIPATDCRFGYRDSVFKNEAGRDLIILSVTYVLSRMPAPRLHYRDLEARFAEHGPVQVSVSKVRAVVMDIRSGKFPDWKNIGTAGSFFKNPIVSVSDHERLVDIYPGLPAYTDGEGRMKLSLGWILDHVCALRGYREGNVGLYERQALVLVNRGGATASEIKNFSKKIREKVFEKTDIEIEMEVRMLGFDESNSKK